MLITNIYYISVNLQLHCGDQLCFRYISIYIYISLQTACSMHSRAGAWSTVCTSAFLHLHIRTLDVSGVTVQSYVMGVYLWCFLFLKI